MTRRSKVVFSCVIGLAFSSSLALQGCEKKYGGIPKDPAAAPAKPSGSNPKPPSETPANPK